MSGVGRNTSQVRDPNWTGVSTELAVAVARGEPTRTAPQMADAVCEQLVRYLASHPMRVPGGGRAPWDSSLVADVAGHVARQVVDVTRERPAGVLLTRDQVLVLAGRALAELRP